MASTSVVLATAEINIAIAFDGWSKNLIHFLAMFAIRTPPNGAELWINLLTASPLAGKGAIGPNDTISNAVEIEATNFCAGDHTWCFDVGVTRTREAESNANR